MPYQDTRKPVHLSRIFQHSARIFSAPLLLAGLATMANQASGQGCNCPPYILTPDPSNPGLSQLTLCPESTFCDLKAAVDYIMDQGPSGEIVELRVPAKTYLFESTIEIYFEHVTPTEWSTIAELRIVSLNTGERPLFKNELHEFQPISAGRRMIYAATTGPAGSTVGKVVFQEINFQGNDADFEATEPVTNDDCCQPNNLTWDYLSGVEARSIKLEASDCRFSKFATNLYINSESETHPHTLDGAAIFLQGVGRLENCEFSDNYAGQTRTYFEYDDLCHCGDSFCCEVTSHHGGAVYHSADCSFCTTNPDEGEGGLTIVGSEFTGNVANEEGGAVRANWYDMSFISSLVVTNSTFNSNIVRTYCNSQSCASRNQGGGAINMGGKGYGEIDQCVFVANEVTLGSGECRSYGDNRPWAAGGAIFCNVGVRIRNSEFYGNLTNDGTGSAIYFYHASSTDGDPEFLNGNVVSCTITSSDDPSQIGSLIAIRGSGVDFDRDVEDCLTPGSKFITIVDSTLHSLSNEKALYVNTAAAQIMSSLVTMENTGPAILVEHGLFTGSGVAGLGPVPAVFDSGVHAVCTQFCLVNGAGCIVELNSCGPTNGAKIIDLCAALIEDCRYSGFSEVFCLPEDGHMPPECWWTGTELNPNGCVDQEYCKLGCESCPADFPTPTRNNKVDGGDLAYLLGYWGMKQADLNCDGNTDGGDLARLLADWGPCSGNP